MQLSRRIEKIQRRKNTLEKELVKKKERIEFLNKK